MKSSNRVVARCVVAALFAIAACDRQPVGPSDARSPAIQLQAPSPSGTSRMLEENDAAGTGALLAEAVVEFPIDTLYRQLDILPPGAIPPEGAVIQVTGAVRLGNGTIVPVSDVIRDGITLWYHSDGTLVMRSMFLNFFQLEPGGGTRYQFFSADAPRDTAVRILYTAPPGSGLQISWGTEEERVIGNFGNTPPTCPVMISFLCVTAPRPGPEHTSDTPPTGLLRVRIFQAIPAPPAAPDLQVSCEPSTVTRGESVRCVAAVTSGGNAQGPDFMLTRRRAKGRGFTIDERPGEVVPGGAEYEWAGVAVANTEVTFDVSYEHEGKTERRSRKASFAVEPRGWDPLRLIAAAEHHIEIGPGLLPYPSNRVLGAYDFEDPVFTAQMTARVDAGPDAGLSFLLTPVVLSDRSVAWIHPGLYGGRVIGGTMVGQAWYQDQNGRPSGTCTQAVIPGLASMAERHEGVTADPARSHWGVTNKTFADEKLHEQFERLYVQGDAPTLLDRADRLYRRFRQGPYRAAQAQFDNTDRPLIFGSLGCPLDWNPSDR